MRSDTNHCLDCIKGIACICVVFIHVHFPGWFGEIVWRLSQFAVPIFFITSGYFAYNCTNEILKRRAKRMLCLSMWTTALYWVVFTLRDTIKNNSSARGGQMYSY